MAKHTHLFSRRKERVRIAIRKKAVGRVRLSIFRSGKHIYAQLIDDSKGVTLAQASTIDKQVGVLIAERAKAAKVKEVVFDRGGYLYHGRVKALADGAREGGLSF
jgi:large subunit ribosomal protein L18